MGDPNWSDVTFIAGFEDAAPNDESSLGQTITLLGSATRSAAQYKYGAKSLAISSTNSGGSVPHDASFFSGSDHFTVETFVRFSSLTDTQSYPILTQWDFTNSTSGWELMYMHNGYSTSGFYFDFGDTSDIYQTVLFGSGWAASVDTWYHVAVDFDGTTYRCYIDGTMVESSTTVYAMSSEASPLGIGCHVDNGSADGNFTGYIDEPRITSGTARYASDGGFTPPAAAHERGEDFSISETVEITDTFATAGIEVISEVLSLSSQWVVALKGAITDQFAAYAYTAPVHVRQGLLEDTVDVTPTIAALPGIVLRERLGMGDTASPSLTYNKSLSDTARFLATLTPTMPVALTETLSMSVETLVRNSTLVLEALRLSDALAPAMLYNRNINESLRLSDTLAKFLGGSVMDSITVAHTLTSLQRTYPTLTDSVEIEETIAPTFILRVIASEEMEISATEAVTMLYNETVAEGVDIVGAYLSPGDGFTSWAMNTRTGAVSEYDNYEFNSFVKMPNNRYVGASSQGLYELVGDSDDGSDIIATIRSGFMQWTGTHLGRFKGVYLATRGADDFVLKLEAGDGAEYNYAVTTRSMRSTKVHIGKGLRARYFAFELISSGADFDLESLEFVPLVAQRRV